MKIKEIMTKEVITVKEDTLIREAKAIMTKHVVSGLPVVDDKRNILGVITEGDFIRCLLPSYGEIHEDQRLLHDFEYMERRAHKLAKTPVKEIMTKKVVTLDENAPVIKAVSLIFLKKIKRILVLREGKLVGIVSREDITKALFGS